MFCILFFKAIIDIRKVHNAFCTKMTWWNLCMLLKRPESTAEFGYVVRITRQTDE